MLTALACGLVWVKECKGGTQQTSPLRDGNVRLCVQVFVESTAPHVGVCSHSAVFDATLARGHVLTPMHTTPVLGRATCPRGEIFALALSGTSATSLRGCEFGMLTGSRLGLAWAMQLYIEVIVTGIKRPEPCAKHEAVCCGLHKSNRVPNAAALTTLPRFLTRWRCWGTPVQREQIFCRTAQMHNVRSVDNFL